MSPSEQEIESALRRAPRPNPPANLKRQLMAQVKLPVVHSESQQPTPALSVVGWFLRRWWPVLAPATASLVLAVVMTAQQAEIRELKESIQTLSRASASEVGPTIPANPANNEPPVLDSAIHEQQEIARLKELVHQLRAEIGRLEQTHTENASVRQQLATPPGLTPEELDALAKARERAQRIACVNNLKQLGLAGRIWANDHKDVFPSEILSMTNEMNTPKILVCPAETNRPVAASWSTYTSANCSYEFLAAAADDSEPERILFRCPIHNNIGLCDGSVQMVSKEHPEFIVERDGKVYLEMRPAAGKPKP